MMLNVRGSIDRCLRGMVWDPGHNIIVCTETWITHTTAEHLQCPLLGFKHFFACRDSARKHGGVSVFVNKDLYCEKIATRVEPEVVALSFGDKDVLLLACYASPLNAVNRHINIFEELSLFMAQLQQHKHVIVLGDFNARIGRLCRVIPVFDDVDPLGLEDNDIRIIRMRNSMDTTLNSRGRQCIRFCEDHSLDILNGCVRGDESGVFTYHSTARVGFSVVDLCLVSADLFDAVGYLRVIDTHELSDHNAVVFKVEVTLKDKTGCSLKPKGKKMIWMQEHWLLYSAEVV